MALGEALLLSVISRVEMEGGVYRNRVEAGLRRALSDTMLGGFEVLPFDDACPDAYRGIVEGAGYSRDKLLDRMTAAPALVHRATLITCNDDDFRDIPGLALLEW